MKKQLTRIPVFSFIIMTMAGCDWVDNDSSQMRLREISDPRCYALQFSYNGDDVASIQLVYGTRVAQVMDFRYRNGRLTHANLTSDYGRTTNVTLEYSPSGQLVKETFDLHYDGMDFEGNPSKSHNIKVFTYQYDGNGQLRSVLEDLEGYEKLERYEYEWQNGNAIKTVRTVFGREDQKEFFVSNTLYRYDNKRNYTNQKIAFRYFNETPLPEILSSNNIVEESDEFGGKTQPRWWRDFSYNRQGYPAAYDYKYDEVSSQHIVLSY
jgi:hypothetical protein